jgi:hypothetical protein
MVRDRKADGQNRSQEWWRLSEAVRFIAEQNRLSAASSCEILHGALKIGHVKSVKFRNGWPKALPPLCWQGLTLKPRWPSFLGSRPILSVWVLAEKEIVRKVMVQASDVRLLVIRKVARKSPAQARALEALDAIWPGGVPASMTAKERDARIAEWGKQRGYAITSKTIQRALRSRS